MCGTGIQIQRYHFLILSESIKSTEKCNFTGYLGTGASLVQNQTLIEENVIDGVTVVMVINPLKPELNPSAQRCLTRFLLGIFLLEPSISLIYA
jgi:hypothetical protein